ncbi:MAG: branched-chain amino acid ABC transporter permease [Oscillospiraceae bacterium]|nr:branched-chain amino acid ABC transporter permease [Oscillospiraceae bacterium]
MIQALKKRWELVLVMCVAAAAVILMLPNNYYAQLLCNIATYGIVVTGLDLCFGYSGQISFGHAAFYCIGAYTAALLSTDLGWDPLLAFAAAIIVAALFGLMLSYPASKLQKHFLSLMTISFGWVVYTFVGAAREVTHGYQGLNVVPLRVFGLELRSMQALFIFALILLILVMIMKRNIVNSRVGRAFQAIRLNAHAANGMGINVRKYKMMAFTLSAALAGMSGAIFSYNVRYVNPESFSSTLSVLLMTMLLFGGIRSYSGPIIGAAVLIFIQDWLQFLGNAQALVYGILIIVVLFFMPNGVAGLAGNIKKRLMKRKEDEQHA